jgi:hypothetical protein
LSPRFNIVGLAGLVACRFGGPSADPDAYVAFPDAAEVGASPVPLGDDTTLSSGDEGGNTAGGDANSGDANTDDAFTTAASADDATAHDASTGDAPSGDASYTREGAACTGAVAVCDPVHNTGCNSLQQCDVDPTQTTTPTGLCVFASPAEGGACLSTIVTESCPPEFTCVGVECRQLCFCDTDCPTGQCCSDTSGPPGFTLCRPCP